MMTDASHCSAQIEFKIPGKISDQDVAMLALMAEQDNLRLNWENSSPQVEDIEKAMKEGRDTKLAIVLVSSRALFGQFTDFEAALNKHAIRWRRLVEGDNLGADTMPGVTFSPRKATFKSPSP